MVEAISLSALPKNATSELSGPISTLSLFMLNVKQGNCEYQLLKSFGLIRPANRAQIYLLEADALITRTRAGSIMANARIMKDNASG